MKHKLALVLALLTLCHVSRATDSAQAKKVFADPPRQYSTGPLWVWNDMLTDEQIIGTMRALAAQDVKQVFVHPRPGLMTPYLSPEWFRLWKLALKEAKRLDMNVWIYDENSYPSGFAGGFVPEEMPESRGRGLAFASTEKIPAWLPEILSIWKTSGDKIEDVSARVRSGEVLPAAHYDFAKQIRAADAPWTGNRCYVDLLHPGVTAKFLEVTIGSYRREIGDQFGKRVPGIFTDEPNINPTHALPWTDDLPQQFQKRWGYDLLANLASLQARVGDWRRVRENYLQLLNELFVERWAKPYHDCCESNHLEWTGHYWEHEWPHAVGVPDNMTMYSWHQRPAIDMLMNQYSDNVHAQFGNARAVRELASVANQLGLKRTLCEAYGAGGWDLRFEDMKRIGDFLSVLGVNTIDQHLSYVTLRGARKRDHPQSFGYQEPWWDAYHVSAKYLARVSAAVSQGQQINSILVIEPTTTGWMYNPGEPELAEVGNSFQKLVNSLEAAQVEYDIGSEQILHDHGSVDCAQLVVGQRKYTTVVLPPWTENISKSTASLLQDYAANGGKIICCGKPATRIDGKESDKAQSLTRSANWKNIEASDLPTTLGTSDQFTIERGTNAGGILFHQRRHLADGELLFLVNTSIKTNSTASFISAQKSVEQWDLNTGRISSYPFTSSDGKITSQFDLPPSGSLLLFLSSKRHADVANPTLTTTIVEPLSAPEITRTEPNVLTLDYADITAAGQSRTNIYCYQANQFAFRQNGMDRNPWDSAVQFKDELITKKFPAKSGFEATYHFTIKDTVLRNLAIVIERADIYTVLSNGQQFTVDKNNWWLDRAFTRFNIATAAHAGDNIVTIIAAPFTIYHELEPAYLLGDFALENSTKGFEVIADKPLELGNWNEQGQPFYSAGVSYREQFQIENKTGTFTVSVPNWNGAVARISVNGRAAGYISSAPWECDITKRLKRGKNTVEVTVVGTLKNTLGPHHGNPPLGAAWPSSFHKAPDSQPAGKNYSTVGYGLFKPFVLKHSTGT
ncbi:MAG: putative alpha-L-rhamnosidase [Verrucomicrobiales bacterium]|nr:putative alpha-L-rhamnosidase [Verrucomicrobiales bacterium]